MQGSTDELLQLIATAVQPPMQSTIGDRDLAVSEVRGLPGSSDRIESLKSLYAQWESVEKSPFEEASLFSDEL